MAHPTQRRKRSGQANVGSAALLFVALLSTSAFFALGRSSSAAIAGATFSSPLVAGSIQAAAISSAVNPLLRAARKVERSANAGSPSLGAIRVGTDLVSPVITSEESARAIRQVIHGAKDRLYLSTHAIEQEYLPDIVAAADRGVSVEVLWNNPRRAGYGKKKTARLQSIVDSLSEHKNISVVGFRHDRLTMSTSAYLPENHMKVYGSDGTRAYVGDANLYFRGENLGAGLYLEGPSARLAEAEFLDAWSLSRGPADFSRVTLPSANPELTLLSSRTPDRNIKAALLADIARADDSIFIMQYYMSDPDILAALRARKSKRPRLDLRVLLGRTHATQDIPGATVRYPFNIAVERELADLGAKVRFAPEELFAHGKLAVIDRRYTHLGSADFTYRSLEGNLELNARVDSTDVASSFLKPLESVFEQGFSQKATRLDTAVARLQRGAENSLYRLAGLRHYKKQAQRAFQLTSFLRPGENASRIRRSVIAKGTNIGSQWLERRVRPARYGDVNLRTHHSASSFDAMDGLIRAELDVQFDSAMAPRTRHGKDMTYLVAGRAEHRADFSEALGAQMSPTGDIGPGVYTATSPRVAFDYAVIHSPRDAQHLLVYEADIQNPLHLPRDRALYENWLRDHPSPLPRARWQQLAEYVREHGHDAVVMDHFEGADSHYVMVLDRDKIRPVHRYVVRDTSQAGWRQVAATTLRQKFGKGPSRQPSAPAGPRTVTALGRNGDPISYTFDATAKARYASEAVSRMQARGLTAVDNLNLEIADTTKHAVASLQAGEHQGLVRIVDDYDTSRYRGIRSALYQDMIQGRVLQFSVYDDVHAGREPLKLYEAAAMAAENYARETGGADFLYLEVRPEAVTRLKKLGFEGAGASFRSKAWNERWVPMVRRIEPIESVH